MYSATWGSMLNERTWDSDIPYSERLDMVADKLGYRILTREEWEDMLNDFIEEDMRELYDEELSYEE